jgi:hypothetical protein
MVFSGIGLYGEYPAILRNEPFSQDVGNAGSDESVVIGENHSSMS